MNGENFIADQLPLKVKIDVTCAQFFVLFGIIFLQNDLVEVARNISVLNEDNGTTLMNLVGGYDDDSEKVKARFVYVNVMKFTMAVVTVAVVVFLAVISSETLNLLRDFAALLIVSHFDDAVFKLFAKNGICGLESMKKAEKITRTKIPRSMATGNKGFCWDIFTLSTVYGLTFVSWIVVLVLQFSGVVAAAKGCTGVSYFDLGNGVCSPNANTAECEWDGGDCKEVAGYPDCRVGFPSLVGNGYYNGGDYNTQECGWDGGDCKEVTQVAGYIIHFGLEMECVLSTVTTTLQNADGTEATVCDSP